MLSNIDAKTTLNNASALRGKVRDEKSSDREAVQLMVIGSTSGIDGIVKSLHLLGFAEANDWSKLQNYPNSDRSMRTLTKWKA
jgi:hypothetical protein